MAHPRVYGVLLALFGAAACASSNSAPEPAPLVKFSDVDAVYADLLLAYGQGGEAWEAARAGAIATREAGDPRQERFLIDNLLLEMVRAYQGGVLETASNRRGPFERAQAELARFGPSAVPLLVEMVASKDGVLAFLGDNTLRLMGPDAAGASLPLLDHDRHGVRLRGAQLLGSLPTGSDADEAVQVRLETAAHNDSNWMVRAQATRAYASRAAALAPAAPGRERARLHLERALLDGDPAVSKEAIDGLARLGDRRSVVPLLSLWTKLERDHSQDPVQTHRDYLARRAAIETALAALTGESRRLGLDEWRRRL